MLARIKILLAPPTFEDDADKNRRAALLNAILLAGFFITLTLYLVRVLPDFAEVFSGDTLIILVISILMVSLLFLLRQGYVEATSYALVTLVWLILTYQAYSADGVRDTAFTLLIVPILIASLLLSWRFSLVLTVLTILAGWGFVLAENAGIIKPKIDDAPRVAQDLTVMFSLAAVLVYLIINNLEKALNRTLRSNQELATLGRELRKNRQELELTVSDLRTNEQRFTLAAEGSQSGIWDWNIQTNIAYFSPRWQTILGMEPGEVSARYSEFERRLHPKDRDWVMQTLVNYLAGEQPEYKLEFRMQHQNGSYIWVEDSAQLLRDETGAPVRMAGSLTNVTERKAAEARILQEQQRVRTILESVSVPLVVSRISDGVALYFNEAIAELIGVPSEKLIGKATPDFYFDMEERATYLHLLQTDGVIDNYEMKLKRAGGEPFWALVSARIIEFEGAMAVITTLVDITARREAQEAIARRAAELTTVSQVGTAASTLLDPDELLHEVVNLTKSRFDLYHAHIYLLDKDRQNLILAAGAGAVGNKMVTEERQISLDQEQSLVARAAREGKGITVNDVREDPGFLANPLLPHTRAEMAVPIAVGDLLMGVLDVQAAEIGRFTQEDVNIHTTLAAQIAVALQNAQQYEKTQTALAETETLLNVTQVASNYFDLEPMLDNILDQVLSTTRFDHGLITLLSKQTRQLEIQNHRLPKALLDMLDTNGIDGTLCDLVYRRQGPVTVLDMVEEAPVDVRGLIGMGYRAYQGAPLQSGGETIGTICIFSNKPLTKERTNTSLLQAVGQQVGIAVNNSFLFAKTQKALSETETFRSLVENATQGIGLSGPSGNFSYVNPVLARMLESEQPAEVVGNGFDTYHADEIREKLWPEIQATMQKTGAWQGELAITLPSGRIMPTQENYFLLYDEQGEFTNNVAVIITDITERKQTEAQRRQLRSQLEEQLAQVNALQRAMTREGWEAFLMAEDRMVQGYQYNQDRIRMISRHDQGSGETDEKMPLSAARAWEMARANDKSAAAAPMQLRGETIGFLSARDPSGNPIDPETQQMLQQISAQVAEALERARLFEETEVGRQQLDRRAQELSAINEVAQSVSRQLDPINLLETIYRQVRQILPTDTFIVAQYDAEKHQISYPIVYDNNERLVEKPSSPAQNSRLFEVIQNGRPVIVDLTPAEVQQVKEASGTGSGDTPENEERIPASLLYVPLQIGQSTVGVLSIQSYEYNAYGEQETNLLIGIANHVAVALENARLFTAAQRRAEREALLNTISQKLQSAPTVERALQTAVSELGQALKVKRAQVRLHLSQENGNSSTNGRKGHHDPQLDS